MGGEKEIDTHTDKLKYLPTVPRIDAYINKTDRHMTPPQTPMNDARRADGITKHIATREPQYKHVYSQEK